MDNAFHKYAHQRPRRNLQPIANDFESSDEEEAMVSREFDSLPSKPLPKKEPESSWGFSAWLWIAGLLLIVLIITSALVWHAQALQNADFQSQLDAATVNISALFTSDALALLHIQTGTLNTSGLATLTNLVVLNQTTLQGTLETMGPATLRGTLDVYGQTNIHNNLIVHGSLTVTGNVTEVAITLLNVTQGIFDTLIVRGPSSFGGSVRLLSSMQIDQNLTANYLRVNGSAVLDIIDAGRLHVTGPSTMDGNVTVYGHINIGPGGTLTFLDPYEHKATPEGYYFNRILPGGIRSTAWFVDMLTGFVGIGTTSPRSQLDVAGTVLFQYVNISGNITVDNVNARVVSGADYITGGRLQITGLATFGGPLIAPNITVQNVLASSSLMVLDLIRGGRLQVDGPALLSSTLNTLGAVSMGSTLSVSGVSTFGAPISALNVSLTNLMGQTATLSDLLRVDRMITTGPVSMGSTMTVTGQSTFQSLITAQNITLTNLQALSGVFNDYVHANRIIVTGAATVHGDVYVNGSIFVAGNITTLNQVISVSYENVTNGIFQGIAVSGVATIGTIESTTINNADLITTGRLYVTGVELVNGLITANNISATYVTGRTATLSDLLQTDRLSVAGAATLSSTLAVAGTSNLVGTVTANNVTLTNLIGTAGIFHDYVQANRLISVGEATIGGAFTSAGAATLSSTLAVAGTSTLTGTVTANNVTLTNLIGTTGVFSDFIRADRIITTGAVTLGSTLNAGATTLASLAVTGTTALTGTLTATNVTLVNLIGTTGIFYDYLQADRLISMGAATIGGTFTSAGAATLSSTLAVAGTSTLTGTVTANNVTLTNLIGTTGIFYDYVQANRLISIAGATIGGALNAGATTLSSLAVTGTSTLTGTVTANNVTLTNLIGTTGIFYDYVQADRLISIGATTVGGTFASAGAATFSSTLAVTGTSTLTGAVTANNVTLTNLIGTTGIFYDYVQANRLISIGATTVGGTFTSAGAATLSSTLAVAGTSTLTGTVTANNVTLTNLIGTTGIFYDYIQTNRLITLDGTTIGGAMSVAGALTLSSTLAVAGTSTFTGNATFGVISAQTLMVSDIEIAARLLVNGNLVVKGNNTATALATTGGNHVYVGGAAPPGAGYTLVSQQDGRFAIWERPPSSRWNTNTAASLAVTLTSGTSVAFVTIVTAGSYWVSFTADLQESAASNGMLISTYLNGASAQTNCQIKVLVLASTSARAAIGFTCIIQTVAAGDQINLYGYQNAAGAPDTGTLRFINLCTFKLSYP